jgi:mono/diheme cytochrome c family protein
MKSYRIIIIVMLMSLLTLFFYGYTNVSAATPASNLKERAMKIIKAQGCLGCHIINGAGGTVGPNLSTEGTKGHSIHWIEAQIKNPAAHDPSSIMPQFHLKASQLETVAKYLDSLK